MNPSARGRFGAVALFCAVFLAIELAVRIALFARALHAIEVSPLLVARTFATGLAFDLFAFAYAAAPFALLLLLAPTRVFSTRPARATVHVLFVFAIFVLLFSAAAEWLFWSEFGVRFNFIAVDYLVYTREVVQNIWESYPVSPIVSGLFVLAIAIWLPLRRTLDAALRAPSRFADRLVPAGALVAIPLFAFFAVDRSWSAVSSNRYANELASNGLYDLFAAFRDNQLDYAPFYATQDEAQAASRLRRLVSEPGARFVGDAPFDVRRDTAPARPERRLNVIVFVVESLSARYLGVFGGKPGLTPHLDAIARQSLLFTNVLATGNRTVRGLEAVTLSVPPTPGNSIVRRPDNGGLFTIATPLRDRGYETRFFYGGFGFFDNMNAFFGANGFEVIDRSSFSNEEVGFANAWGMADEYLFERVRKEAGRSFEAKRPFFSLVMTTSNHKPFTYPEGRVAIPSGAGREGGVQYTDYAFGRFFEEARREPWFDDTVFVIVADHCASSAGRTELPIDKYRIPMMMYSPANVPARRVDTLASQMDLAPTLLALLGLRYESRFLGRDILSTPPSEARALVATYMRLGYVKDGYLTILSPGREVEVQRIVAGDEVEPAQRADAPESVADAIAWYQGASWLWAHRGDSAPAGTTAAAASR